jgi:hypothetical protein
VWRRVGSELVRHCVVASSTTLNTALGKDAERGMFAWGGGEDVEADTSFGIYSGNVLGTYTTQHEAVESCAHMDPSLPSYCMALLRRGSWLVVDALETHDAFLRFVNTPAGLGFAENAHFEWRNGICLSHEPIPPFNLDWTDAENAPSEIWAEYA